jgi:hypothetical protein
MRHIGRFAFLCLTVGMRSAFAGGPVDDAAVAHHLASPDPLVRHAGLVDLVRSEDAEAERVLARVGADAAGAASVARARQARRLTQRLAEAPRGSLAFWRLLESAHGAEWLDLEPAIVLHATRAGPAGRAALLSQRAEALGVVSQFCARGGEFVVPDGDFLAAQLGGLGPRAAAPLLHVLAYDPWSSFFGVGGGAFALTPPGALEQGGAAAALGHLRVREAVPYLLLHLRGPSMTVESAATMSLQKISGIDMPWKNGRSDPTAVLAWWDGERKSRAIEVQDFMEDVLAALLESLPFLELMPHYAADYAQYDQPLGSTYKAVERISGRSLGTVPTGTLEERLAGIRATLAAIRAEGAKKN